MIRRILIIFFITFFFIKLNAQIKSEINIALKVNNTIITNVDIDNEVKYLTAINDKLKSVNSEQLREFAKQSLIKEILKKNELLNYYDLNQDSDFLDNYIRGFYEKLNLDSKQDFELYLSQYDLNYEEIKAKFEIEVVWNEYIYTKYNDQINIDIKKLKQKIDQTKILSNSYLLSEILYQVKSKDEIQSIYKKILTSIDQIGFESTANIYSNSDTSKDGGNIGWINERQLSKNIYDNIQKLDINQISQPIVIPAGFLILKLTDKKRENVNIDKDEELKKLIAFEKNKQFKQFSLIYYNRIRFNSKINEE
jgi:peptidyl-prolyl cis-trans isomerase SurA